MTETAAPRTDLVFALMYASDAVGEIDQLTLDEILEQARAKNARLGITGILLFRRGRFFQYLEGQEDRVRELYAQICQDSRHKNLRVLLEAPTDERRFSAWTMGHEPLREQTEVVPSGFRSTFSDLEDEQKPRNVLRAVTELALWYYARAARA